MIRDDYSKALIETDIVELQRYRKEKKRDRTIQEMQRDIEVLKERINKLHETLQRIEAKS